MKKEPTWGKRMIKVSVRFWTDSLPDDADNKTAWEYGQIDLIGNAHKGIKSDQIFFDRMTDLVPKIGKLFTRNGIKLKKRVVKSDELDFNKL